jgi:hypothetical protein
MVSEGVDIKRLRVGIYATTFKTRMSFHQTIARTTRYDSSVAGLARDGQPVGQPAWFYVPDDPDLQAYMAQIMEISVHHIADAPITNNDDDTSDLTSEGQYTFLEGYEFINGADAVETGHFYEERKWTPEQMESGIRAFDGIPAFDHVPPAAKALAVERVLANQFLSQPRNPHREQTSESIPDERRNLSTEQEERNKLKGACSTQVRKLIYLLLQINQPPKDGRGKLVLDYSRAVAIVTGKLNARFGLKSIGDSTNDQLRERRLVMLVEAIGTQLSLSKGQHYD